MSKIVLTTSGQILINVSVLIGSATIELEFFNYQFKEKVFK